jgi:hypothetical protein
MPSARSVTVEVRGRQVLLLLLLPCPVNDTYQTILWPSIRDTATICTRQITWQLVRVVAHLTIVGAIIARIGILIANGNDLRNHMVASAFGKNCLWNAERVVAWLVNAQSVVSWFKEL